MERMMYRDSLLSIAICLLAISLLVIMGTGCSSDRISAGPTSAETSDAYKTAYESMTRPEVVLPEGLELVTGLSGKKPITTEGNLDDPWMGPRGGFGDPEDPTRPPVIETPDEPCVSMFVPARSAADVHCMFTGVRIPQGVVPYDITVTACMPDEETAIVDFGPHPLEFNGSVHIWFDIGNLHYTEEEIETLQMWYVADDGDLEELPINIDRGSMQVIGHTSHFSRYILTKTGGDNY